MTNIRTVTEHEGNEPSTATGGDWVTGDLRADVVAAIGRGAGFVCLLLENGTYRMALNDVTLERAGFLLEAAKRRVYREYEAIVAEQSSGRGGTPVAADEGRPTGRVAAKRVGGNRKTTR